MTRKKYWSELGVAGRRFVRGQARIRTSPAGNGGAARAFRAAPSGWYEPDWARESIRRGLYPCLAGPVGRLP